jgi:hypothetical protein
MKHQLTRYHTEVKKIVRFVDMRIYLLSMLLGDTVRVEKGIQSISFSQLSELVVCCWWRRALSSSWCRLFLPLLDALSWNPGHFRTASKIPASADFVDRLGHNRSVDIEEVSRLQQQQV